VRQQQRVVDDVGLRPEPQHQLRPLLAGSYDADGFTFTSSGYRVRFGSSGPYKYKGSNVYTRFHNFEDVDCYMSSAIGPQIPYCDITED
jgi:hypothetical protein